MNVKVSNLTSRTNERRHIEWHEACKYKFRLDVSVCNNKQRWNKDTCSCECKELIEKGICNKGFMWNPSNRECECDKSCDAGEYLGYKNCKCRKKIVDKLVEECRKNIDGNKIIDNETLNANAKVCNSCIIYIILFVIFLIISISISNVFIYFHWYLEKDDIRVKFNTNTQTAIYQNTYKWEISKK